MWWFLVVAFVLVIAALVMPMTDPYCEGNGQLAALICGILAFICLGVWLGGLYATYVH